MGRAWWILMWILVALPASAREWTPEDFAKRHIQAYAFQPSGGKAASRETKTVIGHRQTWAPERGDTFLDVGRHFDLGLNSMEAANPGVDGWIPHTAKKPLVIPTSWILPCCRYEGLVVNLPEMRLYWYPPQKEDAEPVVYTFPVGLGRQEWRTPQGDFRVVEKARNPRWVIPESIREERIRETGASEKFIEGGSPDNPLGEYRLRLSMPSYAIHGTNIPWGVGMSVSHGCVRMYPEDIRELFPMVPKNTTGAFVYETIKFGERAGRIFVEVHPDLYGLQPGPWRQASRILRERGLEGKIDEAKLLRALEQRLGYPVDVSPSPEEITRKRSATPATSEER